MQYSAVIQGPIYTGSTHLQLNNLIQTEIFSEIIISTWGGELSNLKISFPIKNVKLKLIENKLPENLGNGNRNAQILSSRCGMLQTDKDSDHVMKMRSDQIFSSSSIEKMVRFYNDNYNYDDTIFTLGMYSAFPFHPRDHLFLGERNSLLKLFAIPLDENIKVNHPNYNELLRAETYIGSYYYALEHQIYSQNMDIYKFINNPLEYLVDNAPLKNEAMKIYDKYRLENRIFRPFPRIDFQWPKYGLSSYHWHIGEQHSEYWHEEK